MKKALIIALSLSMALSALAGCGAKPSEPAESGTPVEPVAVTYVELEENFGAEEYGIGFRKGDVAFGLEVQRIMDEMIADGTAATISEKWFGVDALLKDNDFLKESVASPEDKSLEAIKEKGKIVMGLDDSYPPMGFRDENNKIAGFDIDLATEVAKRMGVEIEFQPIDWDSKELELNGGKIDCIWNGMSITENRLENMFFAKPYIANTQIIIVPSDSGITKKADLEGKVIGLQKGSSSLDALSADPIKDKVKEISEYPDNVSAYMDLKAGRVDVFVVDSVVGRYVISKNN